MPTGILAARLSRCPPRLDTPTTRKTRRSRHRQCRRRTGTRPTATRTPQPRDDDRGQCDDTDHNGHNNTGPGAAVLARYKIVADDDIRFDIVRPPVIGPERVAANPPAVPGRASSAWLSVSV
jgi:hypothetical protein